MIDLPQTRDAWTTPDFASVLKRELKRLGAARLPLQQGLSTTSYALDGDLDVMVIDAADERDYIRARIGVFFAGITAGCNCADDPTPVEAQNEYCELVIAIDKRSARATITLAQ
jgi:hypothetical protein